ncbi:hypothetical protein [Motiliproteus sp.]
MDVLIWTIAIIASLSLIGCVIGMGELLASVVRSLRTTPHD